MHLKKKGMLTNGVPLADKIKSKNGVKPACSPGEFGETYK